jgi:hypothetical protein
MRPNATVIRKKKAKIRRESVSDPDTARQLMVTSWPYCGVIQDIIDRIHEAGSNTEHLLANRLQRLAFRATPVLSRK